jgi:thiol-disulfide isomerase/thioredoxin
MSTAKPRASRKNAFSRSEKIAIPIIILIAIWVVYSISQPVVPSPPTSTTMIQTTGTPGAPDFTLPVVTGSGLSGQTLTLSSFRGKVVLLEFMEPWCPHCQEMVPVLEKLYTQYGKSDVAFISVAAPWQGSTTQDVAHFINDYGSSWTYVYDSSGTIVSEYGVTGTPTFLIIGKDGTIVARYEGQQTFDTLASGLISALTATS